MIYTLRNINNTSNQPIHTILWVPTFSFLIWRKDCPMTTLMVIWELLFFWVFFGTSRSWVFSGHWVLWIFGKVLLNQWYWYIPRLKSSPCSPILWASSSAWWFLHSLCRIFLVSGCPICHSFLLIAKPLEFYLGSDCLCLYVPVYSLFFPAVASKY
jgi:hypothetical protein